jgi:nucleoid-associated protein YgaU
VKATAAETSVSQEFSRAGETARRGAASHRRRPARGAVRRVPRATRRVPLRLVVTDGRLLSRASSVPVRTTPGVAAAPSQPVAPLTDTPRRPDAPRPSTPRPSTPRPSAPVAARTPVRLTRRGRLVVAAAALLVAAAVSVVLAGAAQALGHSGGPARPGAGITKVQVQPGQNLWTLAEAYDPNADPRQVIQEILQLNSMSTDQLQPGQVLWMPRD